ncbi:MULTISPECIES: hypothetical protein [Streptacidiphilus]|uniref:DUF2007 domain-containing protein n=1 Tax=Streptacidiphilus cavernicola TaxID=3342716 RepID=A0ABV6UXE1_9ACTN|nr:hypothetical protein [Streptacidiphilus jeojiense]
MSRTPSEAAQVAKLLRDALDAQGITTPVQDGSHLFPESTKGWVTVGLIDVSAAYRLLELVTRQDADLYARCQKQ